MAINCAGIAPSRKNSTAASPSRHQPLSPRKVGSYWRNSSERLNRQSSTPHSIASRRNELSIALVGVPKGLRSRPNCTAINSNRTTIRQRGVVTSSRNNGKMK
ncbi:hypothetical protein D3C84_1042100 [compost metagenome]